jgi:magnesium-transporting ATPase (P-type)
MSQANKTASRPDLILTAAKTASSYELYQLLDSSEQGLNADQAKQRLQKYGPNAIAKVKGESWFKKFGKNFTSLMAILLWIAGAIAFFAQLPVLGWAIWAVNIINGLFSFWQEFQASKA